MLDLLLDFPEQLKEAAWIGRDAKVAKAISPVSNVVFSGVGGSAIAGDVIKCILLDEIKIPFVVNRDYFVPGFVNSKTLFFASSYSGNTEETLAAYKDAKKKKAKIIVIASGGELEKLAKKDGYPAIEIPTGMPPRCALGYLFVPALFVLSKSGLIKDKGKDIDEAISTVINLRKNLAGPRVSSNKNIAKKIASLLAARFCAIYGWSKHLDCVITRWRNQLNENSKAIATTHFLPEMNHNEIMGFSHPKKLLKDIVVIFLRDKDDYVRIKKRIGITSSIIKKKVHKIIEVNSQGKSVLSRICSLIYIGDFVSFYLAILNNEDPTPVDEISYLKKELARK